MAYTVALKGVNLSSAGKQVKTVHKICTHSNIKPSFFIASSNIFGSHKRDPDYKRPKPYPYKTKRYGLFQRAIDRTTYRFDDNTKLIVVEGPPAIGKSEFAKKLAEDFDMLYMEDATMDNFYINHLGFDFRTRDPYLPPAHRSYDVKNFCQDPKHRNAAFFQVMMFKLRFANYVDALAHILSTGQGVVLERSPYTDIGWAEGMRSSGFMSKAALYVYNELRRHTLYHLMRPHLYIYLDVPVPTVLQRIKERDLPHERNSPALTEKFLTDVEMGTKANIMTVMNKHADVLVYDWTEGGDIEVVIEDIENIDFDVHTGSDLKMQDWRKNKEVDYCNSRQLYADYKTWVMAHFNVPLLDAPELLMGGQDSMIFFNEYFKGLKYQKGYNTSEGDTGLFWKWKVPKQHWLPIS